MGAFAAKAGQTKPSKRVNSIYEKSARRGRQNMEQLWLRLGHTNCVFATWAPCRATRAAKPGVHRVGISMGWRDGSPLELKFRLTCTPWHKPKPNILGPWTSFGDGIYIRIIKQDLSILQVKNLPEGLPTEFYTENKIQ